MSAHPSDLDRFITAYVECALWSSNEGADDTPMNENYDAEDIAESSMTSIRADCAQFVREQAAVLDYCDETGDLPLRGEEARAKGFSDAYAMAGHDFWLTRNHHGAGFWDGDWNIDLPAPEGGFSAQAGDVLTDAAHKFGECDLYVGDDGQVYVTPERKAEGVTL